MLGSLLDILAPRAERRAPPPKAAGARTAWHVQRHYRSARVPRRPRRSSMMIARVGARKDPQ